MADYGGRLGGIQKQLRALQQHTGDEPAVQGEPLDSTLAELSTSLEELRVAEEELRQQNEELAVAQSIIETERQRYQDLFEFAPDGYLVTDIHGTVIEANQATCGLFNLSRGHIIGKPLIVFFTEEDRQSLRYKLIDLRSAREVREWELRLHPRARELISVAVRVAVVRDHTDQPTALRWSVRDVSERKQAEQQIRQLNARLEQRVAERTAQLATVQQRLSLLAEASRLLSSSLDLQSTLASLTHLIVPALADWCIIDLHAERLPYRVVAHADPAKERRLRTLPPLSGAEAAERYSMHKVMHSGRPGEGLSLSCLWLVTGSRDPEHLDLLRDLGLNAYIVVPIVIAGEAVGSIALVTSHPDRHYELGDLDLAEDLAHRCALAIHNATLYDAAQRALRLRDEFLSSISHDLKIPLAGISGYTQLLQRRITGNQPLNPARLSEGLARIDGAVSRMMAMIGDLIEVVQAERVQAPELDRRPTDLVALIQHIVAEHEAAGLRDRFNLTCTAPELVGPWDAARLERVIGNLISNAIKYSPAASEITLTLVREDDPSGAWAVLTVQDRGIGIPAADLPHIFERFHRASNVIGSFGGTGIGLASVRQLIEHHGGTITVASQEGCGSTFTVRLPLSNVERDGPPAD